MTVIGGVMRRTFGLLVVLALALSARTALAEPFKHPVFGAFSPGMSWEDAVRAAPHLRWERHPSLVRRNETSGVSASEALEFLGRRWDVQVGDTFGHSDPSRPMLYNVYEFDIRTTAPVDGRQQCFALLGPLIEAMEPAYGAFGRHPAFAHADNTLYGALGAFQLRGVGDRSQTREYRYEYGVQDWTTFAEFDESSGQYAMVKATYFDQGRHCDLRVDIAQSPERAQRAATSRAKYAR
jgi:hypothetical protein